MIIGFLQSRKKGAIQIDFIIAIAVFIVVFAVVVQTITAFFTTVESTSQTEVLTAHALSLLGVADFEFTPAGWNGTGDVQRIGLSTRSYRLEIIMSNNQSFLINQSQSVTDLSNELVSFNYSDMGFSGIDVNSTVIYDGSTEVPYQINGSAITFRRDISANAIKVFILYFDDDSNFSSRSTNITGSNVIGETIYPAYPLTVVQHKKLQALNSSNYSAVMPSLQGRDFRITLYNTEVSPNTVFFEYGGEVSRAENVVSVQRYALFQNSTGGVIDGKIVVQTW